MSSRSIRMLLRSFSLLFLIVAASENLPAQEPTGILNGVVTDPSGGVIAKASVRLIAPSGASLDTSTNRDGYYEFKGLAPDTYTVKAVAKGFALFTKENVQILAGQLQQLNINLTIQIEEQKVEVTDSPNQVDVNPANNAGMIVLKDKDLEALSDDPDELQSELQALAGPSAGPNGGQMYIDGFTAGQLPPKASIREIRINQNPFSAEYDKLGYGRIEIFTKPGSDRFHGQAFVMGNTDSFNSRNPFEGTAQQPGYYSTHYSANLGGPLGKNASFFFNIERRNINELSVINTPFVDSTTFQQTLFTEAVPNPHTRTNVSQRFDYQASKNNTLTGRYQYWRNDDNNNGVGTFSLPSLGYNSLSSEHQLQISDTQVLSPRTINETRLQYVRQSNNQSPLDTSPMIQIQGAFTGGGSSGGPSGDTQDRYELQNYTSMSLGKHFLKYGFRLRETRDTNQANSGFNGSFSFGPRIDRTNPNCAVQNPPSSCIISGIEAYQKTLQYLASGNTQANLQLAIQNGGGASFYSVTAGSPAAYVSYFDAGLYAQDDWRIRPNVTLSYGLRFESQNNLGDHADFAPRVGIAWGLDGSGKKSPKTVLRGGFGIFYDRFASDLVLQQERLNAITQQRFLVANPDFYTFNTPDPSSLPASSSSTIYQLNPNLRAPYVMQTGATIERQLTKSANLSVTYLNSRGLHQFYTNFINATSPGTPPPSQIIYQYQSGGIFKQNQLIVNSSIRMGQKLSLFGYYTLNYANSDTSGAGSMPSNPFDILQDYGRASFDVRHRIFFGGSVGLPAGFRVSPFLVASSGSPFNITTGQDLYGNAVYNTRASLGTCGDPGVVSTAYGCFNSVTQPGQTVIPINDFTGPSRFGLNLRLSKTFGFGAKKEATAGGGPGGPGMIVRGPGGGGGGGPRGGGEHGGGGPMMFGGGGASNQRYNLTFSVNARNVFNNVNEANPIGNLTSPFFGRSNALASGPFGSSTANRRIDLQLQFSF